MDPSINFNKYPLELTSVAVGGKSLELYRVENIDSAVNRLAVEGESYIKSFPLWVKVWEASLVLADHLCQVEAEGPKNILELGAGMGVVGLLLGALGHRVTITDYDTDALELLRINAQHNGLDNVTVHKLDWKAPDLEKAYDVICGAEIVYKESAIDPIIRLIEQYLRSDGVAYMAHNIQRMYMFKFMGAASERFHLGNQTKTMRGETETHRILINTIRKKG